MISEALDFATPIISAIAACFSAIAACFSAFYANKTAKVSNMSAEIEVRKLIIEAKMRFVNYGENKKLYDFLVEELNNAYDEISSKYLDDKLDKKTFEKIYKHEIINWVESFKPDMKKYTSLYETYNKLKSI